MAHEMTITLSDDEYAALAAQATVTGKPAELIAHDLLSQRLSDSARTSAHRPLSASEFTEQQYREGKILNLPTRVPLTSEEAAERERRARLLSGGTPASDIVIEDRGPR